MRLPSHFLDSTEKLLERAVLDALAVAGKAGLVAAGFTKAETALAREKVVALLHAAEASSEGTRKLDASMRRRSGETPVVIGFLASAQLDLALNRPNVRCSPVLRAKPFWRVAGALNGFGPAISTIRPERLRRT